MSTLPEICGHEEVRASLARAARKGSLASSILLHGRPGIGRQRLGLWLAQLLHCTSPHTDGPCNQCQHCRFSLRLEHPDVHWFFPLPRPRGTLTPEKLAEALEDARMAALAERREDPLRPQVPGEPLGLYLAQVHTIRKLAGASPAMAARKVFLIGNAELLVPQEGSTEAANAVLKLLEEPPADTTVILTAAQPDALPTTVRSRLLAIRLRPLPDQRIADFLRQHCAAAQPDVDRAARLAQGTIGRALAFLATGAQTPPLEHVRAQARALLEAAASTSATGRFSAALALSPTGARGTFRDVLEFLALWLRDLAAIAAGDEEHVVNDDARAFLADLARRLPAAAAGVPDAIKAVYDAHALAATNVNPQLTTSRLLRSIHSALYQSS